MKKQYAKLHGKRLFNLHTGLFGRVTEVLPHGKTSARFVVRYETSRFEWTDTYGELTKHNVFVSEEYRHELPTPAERLRKLIAIVDERCGEKVQVFYGHYTTLDRYVKDEANGKTVCDGFSAWRAVEDSKYVMGIGIWGSGLDLSLDATYAEVNEKGGNLWAVFKPKAEALAAGLENGGGVAP